MAGTTNLLQWNPTAANQETDAAYAADAQRAGGATDPSVFESVLANKLFFQLTTYLTALFQAFAAKGFTTSDSNLSTLTATCAGFLTTADLRAQIVDLASSPTQALDASKANAWFMPLTAATTLTISGMTDGQVITLVYAQDAVGGRAMTFPTSLFEAVQPDPRVNAFSAQSFIYVAAGGGFFRALGPLMSDDGSTFVKGNSEVTGAVNAGTLQVAGAAPNGEVLMGNGTSYVPSNVAMRGALVTNSNGSYFRWSDGVMEAWGSVSVPPSGNAFNTATITFPAAFVGTPSLTFSTVGYAGSGDSTTPPAVELHTLSNTSAAVFMARVIVASAGGGNFDNTLTLVWHAIGV